MDSEPPRSRHVLATGAAGRHVCAELVRREHRVRAFDIRTAEGVPDAVVADLADADVVGAAVYGVDCVLHLGGTPYKADFMSAQYRGRSIRPRGPLRGN